jgi:hypothetical protein
MIAPLLAVAALTAASPLSSATAPVETDGGTDDPFGWIRAIESGPAGQKIALNASTVYEIDRQYQLPRGTELVGAGTDPASRTVIRAVGSAYSYNCGANATNRKGLVLGDDTVVRGLHVVGMETRRQPCLCAMIETPGCASGENTGCASRKNHTVSPDCYYSSPPTETECGGVIGKTGGNGARNATVEDITVEAATTTTMFFMNPSIAGLRPSSDITVRNCRSSQTHADGISTSMLSIVTELLIAAHSPPLVQRCVVCLVFNHRCLTPPITLASCPLLC